MKLQLPSRKISASRFQSSGRQRPAQQRMHLCRQTPCSLIGTPLTKTWLPRTSIWRNPKVSSTISSPSAELLQSDHEFIKPRMLVVPL